MKTLLTVLTGATLALGVQRDDPSTAPAVRARPFALATLRFEGNATDGDVEVVFEVMGGADGLAWLTVTGPDGRTVVDFKAPDPSTLGVRQFELESPEPPDPNVVMAAYPEGVYTFVGGTARGDTLRSQATLSHRLPPPVTRIDPEDDAEDVPTKGVHVTWGAVQGVVAYKVVVEDEETGQALTLTLDGGARGLSVPDEFLKPGTSYQLAIGTVGANGNVSFIENGFTTAEGM